MQQQLSFTTATNEGRVQIFDGRFTFFLFWFADGHEPTIFIDPNITEFGTVVRDGQEMNSATITMGPGVCTLQFKGDKREFFVDMDGSLIKVTLLRKTELEDRNAEVDLLVEDIEAETE